MNANFCLSAAAETADRRSGHERPFAEPSPDRAAPWVGQRLTRLEDERLVTGQGRFTADFHENGMLHAVVLRAQVACGKLRNVDISGARNTEGVVLVLTAADAAQDRLGGIPWEVCPPGFESVARYPGDPMVSEPQPILASDKVRYVGEPIALIVAETLESAINGAEQVVVEIDDEDPVVEVSEMLLSRMRAKGESPVFTYKLGDQSRTDHLMQEAALVVEIETHIPRLIAAPLETRGYIAQFDTGRDQWTVVAAAGKPHPVRDTIAKHVLGVPPQSIRVIAPDIGGGFGAKNVAHAEMALVLWASKRIGRPVRWICTRNESFLSDMQSRDHLISARLAVDASGRLLAIDYRSIVNLGAYLAPRGVVPSISGLKVLTGPYKIEAMAARVDAVKTNTVPTCPYRGAGVPETAFVVERLVDMAARRLGLDPADIRRRNLIQPEDLPWHAPTGAVIHSVDFPAVLDAALERSRWSEARSRSPSKGSSCRRGIGMAFTIEGYGMAFDEAAEIVADGAGVLEVRIGTKSSGQSHETVYAQIAADALGLDPEAITIVQGDTARIVRGNGTGASRSITTGGSAIHKAAARFLAEARAIAARLLQCKPDLLDYANGRFEVRGHLGSGIDLASIARSLPDERLHVSDSFQPDRFTFPGGCHVAEVEVDVDTGEVDILSYVAVHDAGVAINPTVVEGQLHGGIAQGIGAAIMEAARYDADNGQALAATFQDYAIPRADSLTKMDIGLVGPPCASNPLGAKAAGEAGTVAAPPAVINAIVDALSDIGVEHIDLPATPMRVWNALQDAKITLSTKRLDNPPTGIQRQ